MNSQPDGRIFSIAQTIGEMFGDELRDGPGTPSRLEQSVAQLLDAEELNAGQRHELFNCLYGPDALMELEGPESITIAELWIMMKLCDVATYTLAKPK